MKRNRKRSKKAEKVKEDNSKKKRQVEQECMSLRAEGRNWKCGEQQEDFFRVKDSNCAVSMGSSNMV